MAFGMLTFWPASDIAIREHRRAGGRVSAYRITPQCYFAMSLSVSALPPDFSWLRESCRPSDDEIDAYAHVIANREGYPPENSESRLHDEAELQLWIWRVENRSAANRRPFSRPRSSAR